MDLLLPPGIEHAYDPRMLEKLQSAIDGLEIPLDGDAIVEVFALIDLFRAKLLLAAAKLDAAELQELDVAMSGGLSYHVQEMNAAQGA